MKALILTLALWLTGVPLLIYITYCILRVVDQIRHPERYHKSSPDTDRETIDDLWW